VPVPAVPMIESLREGEAPAVERLPKEQRQVGKHPPTTVYRSPKEVDDDELLEALRANGWRLKPTAAQLHVSRTSLYALIDRCPRIRRATDLGREELATCFERYKGRLERMADALEVSPQGLRHRLQELGLGGSASS
ncbi:MAG: helix-turn-helix domain-containing protein, partial [Acidobacteriota bacterium]